MFFPIVKRIAQIVVLTSIIATLFFAHPVRTEAYSAYSLQANISGVINTLSLKVYCGITNLFAKSCGVDLATSTTPEIPVVQTDEVLVATEQPAVPQRVTGAEMRERVVEKIVERVVTPIGFAGISQEYLDQRLAELASELRAEIGDKTVTVRTNSRSDGVFSGQVDQIYEDMNENIDEAIAGIDMLSEAEVISLISVYGATTSLASFDTDDLAEGSTNLYSQWADVPGGISYSGDVTATTFYGDGSNLTGITSFSTSTTRSVFSSSATGLTYAPSTGIFSLTSGYVIPLTASTTEWASKVSSQWTTSGADIYFDSGNVGIGTTTPGTALTVAGNTHVTGGLGIGTTNTTAGTIQLNADGAIGAPSIGWGTTGFYKTAGGSVIYTQGGVNATTFTAGGGISTIGNLTTGSGTAGAPAYSFAAQTTLGMWRAGTDLLAFSTASTERMRIDASGNVGIGTTTPIAKLAITGSGTGTGAAFVITDSGNSNRFMVLDNGTIGIGGTIADPVALTGGILIVRPLGSTALSVNSDTPTLSLRSTGSNSVNGGTLAFSTLAGAETATITFNASDNRLYTTIIGNTVQTIDYAGNLGIGTTTPTTKLDVWGGFNVGTSSTPTFSVSTSGGRVGINTTAQYVPFYVYSTQDKTALFHRNTTANMQSVAVNLSVLTGFSDAYQKAAIIFQRDDSYLGGFGGGKLIFAVNNTADSSNASTTDARMVILPNGNVGIGTTTPIAKLDVYAGDLYFGSSTYNTTIKIADITAGNTLTGGSLTISAGSATLGSNMSGGHLILQAGNSRTGASHASGDLRLYTGANNFSSGGTFGDMEFYTGGYNGTHTQAMTLSGTNGYLGIGTTTPVAKLAISGTAGTGDIFAIASSTNTRLLTLTAAGNLGIGVSNPDRKLVVVESDAAYVPGAFRHTSSTGYSGLHFLDAGGTLMGHVGYANTSAAGIPDKFYVGSVAAKEVVLTSNALVRMTVTSGGNIGIGTTTPGTLLDIGGGGIMRVGGAASPTYPTFGAGFEMAYDTDANAPASGVQSSGGSGASLFQSYSRDASTWKDIWFRGLNTRFDSNNGFAMIINSSGNVGIGTTTPGSKLDISAGGVSGGGVLRFSDQPASINDLIAVYRNNGTAGWKIQAAGGSQEFFRVTDSGNTARFVMGVASGGTGYFNIGNFGFGTTTPSASLAVTGVAGTTDIFALASSTNARLLTVTSAGKLGIGTTPTALLDLLSTTEQARFGYDASNYMTLTVAADGESIFDSVGTDAEFSFSDNVGINTTSPATELDIYGSNGGAGNVFLTRNDSTTVIDDELGGIAWGSTDGPSPNAAAINVYATESFSASAAGTYMTFRTTPTGTDTITEQMRLTDTGYLGIGTTTPARRLHVYTSADEPPVRFQDASGYCEIDPTSTSWSCTSDERLKDNITDLDSGDVLSRMSELRPVNFTWKNGDSDTKRTGLIAQEVERIFPELVHTDENGYKSVSYGGFTVYFISAIKQLTERFEKIAAWFGNDRFTVIGDICVDDVCVSKEEFKNLLRSGANVHDSIDDDDGDPAPTEPVPGGDSGDGTGDTGGSTETPPGTGGTTDTDTGSTGDTSGTGDGSSTGTDLSGGSSTGGDSSGQTSGSDSSGDATGTANGGSSAGDDSTGSSGDAGAGSGDSSSGGTSGGESGGGDSGGNASSGDSSGDGDSGSSSGDSSGSGDSGSSDGGDGGTSGV